ncbi:hypothetical protein [Citrobacter koseri]|uniref:hypothetical protein n=1 Tax=Citrobacter koseri TaxID=545 RepID=UPI003891BB7D
MEKQKKPSGISTSIEIRSSGIQRKTVDFPQKKSEIELLMAEAFCAGKPALNPHIARYGSFTNLEPQPENSLDFSVHTEKGSRWLELAEFAPLNHFGGRYENVPATWVIEDMQDLFLTLIKKKSSKGYGDGVILLIYKTHDTLFVPPPVLRCVRSSLISSPPPFDAIYFISAHSIDHAAVWQVWPDDVTDEGPMFASGTIQIGID